jgi:hypothetical protein
MKVIMARNYEFEIREKYGKKYLRKGKGERQKREGRKEVTP